MTKITTMAEVLRRHRERVAEQQAEKLASEVLAALIEMMTEDNRCARSLTGSVQ